MAQHGNALGKYSFSNTRSAPFVPSKALSQPQPSLTISPLIAAQKTGRISRLMELDPVYCDVIIKRWQDFTGKKAVHAETGKLFDDQEIPV